MTCVCFECCSASVRLQAALHETAFLGAIGNPAHAVDTLASLQRVGDAAGELEVPV